MCIIRRSQCGRSWLTRINPNPSLLADVRCCTIADSGSSCPGGARCRVLAETGAGAAGRGRRDERGRSGYAAAGRGSGAGATAAELCAGDRAAIAGEGRWGRATIDSCHGTAARGGRSARSGRAHAGRVARRGVRGHAGSHRAGRGDAGGGAGKPNTATSARAGGGASGQFSGNALSGGAVGCWASNASSRGERSLGAVGGEQTCGAGRCCVTTARGKRGYNRRLGSATGREHCSFRCADAGQVRCRTVTSSRKSDPGCDEHCVVGGRSCEALQHPRVCCPECTATYRASADGRRHRAVATQRTAPRCTRPDTSAGPERCGRATKRFTFASGAASQSSRSQRVADGANGTSGFSW